MANTQADLAKFEADRNKMTLNFLCQRDEIWCLEHNVRNRREYKDKAHNHKQEATKAKMERDFLKGDVE